MKLQDFGYYIQAPQKGRISWAIIAYTESAGYGRKYIPAKDPRLKDLQEQVRAINLQLRDKENRLSDIEVRIKLEEIIKDRYRDSEDLKTKLRASVINDGNQALFRRFWKEKYELKENKDLSSAEYDFKRALKMIGDLPLDTAKPRDLFIALRDNAPGVSQRKKATSRINEMLSYLNRGTLPVPNDDDEEANNEIKYLTRDEVFQLSEKAPNHLMKIATLSLFGAGFRVGELLAITPDRLGDLEVYVGKQMRTGKKGVHGKTGAPKRNSKGWVEVLPFCWDALVEWAEVDKNPEMKKEIWEFVSTASRQLWPKRSLKHITTHDLRHSHAIYLLEQGASLADVARNLRNKISTCEKYYTGFCHTDGTRKRLATLLSSPKK